MKKNYIIPSTKIGASLLSTSIMSGSRDITTNGESGQGGTGWTGGGSGLGYGEGDGSDANNSKGRGFYSGYCD